MSLQSIFASYEPKGYPFRFTGTLHIPVLAGGTPSNKNVAEAWIASKGIPKDEAMTDAVAELMQQRGLSQEQAIEEVAKNRHLVGFKRDPKSGLYIEGRQLKACIKEAASVARAVGKLNDRWGLTRKGIESFTAEHIFVEEQRLYLDRTEPDTVHQAFIHTFRGDGIQYTEICEDVNINFTVESDHEFKDEEWAMLWLTAERQGLGACRSQGYGRFTVIKWERAGQVKSIGRTRKAA